MGSSISFPTVDLSGKVVIITGGNAGIGYETAKAIAGMGAHTIIACRSEEKATAAIEQMKTELAAQFPDNAATIDAMPLDLASFRSTKDFVTAFKEKNLPLHILINNAGILGTPLVLTEDGFESHFQVNHLSHFLLTLELLPILQETAASSSDVRIVIVSGGIHKLGVFDPNNMNGERSYSRIGFYCHSKLYNVMHAYALQRRLHQVGITVSVLHPGVVDTELVGKGVSDSKFLNATQNVFKFFSKSFMKDNAAGAVTTINCAVNPELNSQECFYYDSCRPVAPSALSLDTNLQEQLWDISMKNVREWLSPELIDKYSNQTGGGLEEPTTGQEQVPTTATGQGQVPTTTTGQEQVPTTTTGQEQVPTTTTGQEQVPTTTTGQEQVPTTTTTGQEQVPTTTTTGQEQVPTTTTGQEQVPTTTTGQEEGTNY